MNDSATPTTSEAGQDGGLSTEDAEAIWTILAEECGASSDPGFLYHQTRERVTEWRFSGRLGFGGKFWRTRTMRPDGSWGEHWYVNYYPEHQTTERDEMQRAANARLWSLLTHTEEKHSNEHI